MGVVKHLECCAVVAISKPATLLPFGLAGSMPSFRALAETITGHYLGIYVCFWHTKGARGMPIHLYQLASANFDFSVLY